MCVSDVYLLGWLMCVYNYTYMLNICMCVFSLYRLMWKKNWQDWW